jgi:DNA polymerase I-like protein with 3'-5' exonuclease and polymerase domains
VRAEIDHWLPTLVDEIAACQPEVIITLGAVATRLFLPEATLERTHGLAFCHGNERAHISFPRGATLFVSYNPAAALRAPELQSYFAADMEALGLGLRRGFRHWHPDRLVPRYGLLPLGCRIPRTFSIDTEGWPSDPWCLTIAWAPGTAYLVPADDARRLAQVRRALARATRVTCQGLLYDLDVLRALDLTVPDDAIDDTQIRAYLLSLEPQALKDLAYRHLGATQEDYAQLVASADDALVRGYVAMVAATHPNPKVVKAAARVLAKLDAPDETRPARKVWAGSKFSRAVDPPPAVHIREVRPQCRAVHYACRDADLTERLQPILDREIRARGLQSVYARDLAVVPIVHRMQHVGMRVDPAHFRGLLTQFTHEFLDNQAAITRLLGREVNPNSGPQVAALLFDELHLEGQRLVKSQTRYSTEDKYLEALRGAHPVVPLILEGRELTKLRSAYAAAILSSMREVGNAVWHVFPNLRITRVATGRVSAFDPNVLAIPKHSARGTLIRQGFLAHAGHVLLSSDLSQVELRVAAHDAQCQGMIDIFRAGGDIHAALGQRVFGIPPEQQDESAHRLPCKKVNFGIWMGISPLGMSEQIQAAGAPWTEAMCADLITETFKVWPEIPRYQSAKIAEARRLGYVTDFAGRRRYLAGVDSAASWVRREAERQAHATPVQSGAQAVFKEWMACTWRHVIQPAQARGAYCEPWLQVHDDLILEVDMAAAATIARQVRAAIPQMLCVPVTAKTVQADTWGALR